jgi:hypothetical protein
MLQQCWHPHVPTILLILLLLSLLVVLFGLPLLLLVLMPPVTLHVAQALGRVSCVEPPFCQKTTCLYCVFLSKLARGQCQNLCSYCVFGAVGQQKRKLFLRFCDAGRGAMRAPGIFLVQSIFPPSLLYEPLPRTHRMPFRLLLAVVAAVAQAQNCVFVACC